MVLLMAVSFSFAQMKNVKEAKSIANDVKPNFKQAEQLIKEAMKNPETKDLAETWDVAGFIQKRINEEQMKNAFLRKPYDTMNITEKTGKLVTIKSVTDENDLMIINKSGITSRLKVEDVRIMGRATQGVRLINLEKRNDQIGSVCKVMTESLEDEIPEEEVEGTIVSDPNTDAPDIDNDDTSDVNENESNNIEE